MSRRKNNPGQRRPHFAAGLTNPSDVTSRVVEATTGVPNAQPTPLEVLQVAEHYRNLCRQLRDEVQTLIDLDSDLSNDDAAALQRAANAKYVDAQRRLVQAATEITELFSAVAEDAAEVPTDGE